MISIRVTVSIADITSRPSNKGLSDMITYFYSSRRCLQTFREKRKIALYIIRVYHTLAGVQICVLVRKTKSQVFIIIMELLVVRVGLT